MSCNYSLPDCGGHRHLVSEPVYITSPFIGSSDWPDLYCTWSAVTDISNDISIEIVELVLGNVSLDGSETCENYLRVNNVTHCADTSEEKIHIPESRVIIEFKSDTRSTQSYFIMMLVPVLKSKTGKCQLLTNWIFFLKYVYSGLPFFITTFSLPPQHCQAGLLVSINKGPVTLI